MRSFTYVLNVNYLKKKNDITPSTRLYVLDGVINSNWRSIDVKLLRAVIEVLLISCIGFCIEPR